METKRRAAVNRRPAGSKWMRSGSPSVSLLELGDRLLNSQRTAGSAPRFQPARPYAVPTNTFVSVSLPTRMDFSVGTADREDRYRLILTSSKIKLRYFT